MTIEAPNTGAAVTQYQPQYIYQQALLQCPGCPDALAAEQLNRVLRDFYLRTTGWRQVIGPYNIQAANDTVTINPVDTSTLIAFVHDAWIYPTLQSNQRTWLRPVPRRLVGGDKYLPSTYFMQDPSTLVLYPVPDQAYGNVLYVYASCVPTPNATALPSITFTYHLDDILSGLLAKLFGMNKKPWSNKEGAQEHGSKYRRSLLTWRAAAERNYGPADKPNLFPPFANRGSITPPMAVIG